MVNQGQQRQKTYEQEEVMNNMRGNYIDRLGLDRHRDQPSEPKSARLRETGTTNRFSMDTYAADNRASQNTAVNLTVVKDPQSPKEMQRTELTMNQQE